MYEMKPADEKFVYRDVCDERTRYTNMTMDEIKRDIHTIKHNHLKHIQDSIINIEKTLVQYENEHKSINNNFAKLLKKKNMEDITINKSLFFRILIIFLVVILILSKAISGDDVSTLLPLLQ